MENEKNTRLHDLVMDALLANPYGLLLRELYEWVVGHSTKFCVDDTKWHRTLRFVLSHYAYFTQPLKPTGSGSRKRKRGESDEEQHFWVFNRDIYDNVQSGRNRNNTAEQQELSHVGSTSTDAEDTSRSSSGSGQQNAPFSFGTRDEDMAMLIQARRTPGGRYRLEQALLSRIAPEVMAENNQYRPVFSSIELYQLFGLAPSHPYQPDPNNQRN